MGNFMVLNLFLALLLNSFNSEELKSKKEEVGDESKLAKSFERIRSIVRKGRLRRKSGGDVDANGGKLEQLVHEIVLKQREEKLQKGILVSGREPPPDYTATTSRCDSMVGDRSDYIYEMHHSSSNINNINNNQQSKVVKTISGSQETVTDVDDRYLPDLPDDKRNQGILLHQMSSGFGNQQSKDDVEPLELTESVEIRMRKGMIPQQSQHKRQSCPMPRQYFSPAHAIDTNSNSSSCTYSEISKQLKRLSSNQSINTLSLDHEDLLNQLNLKDELLNCDKKELFQFLRDETFINENNFYNNSQNEHALNSEAAAVAALAESVRKSVHIQDEIELLRSPVNNKPAATGMMMKQMTSMHSMNAGDVPIEKPWHCLVSYVDDLTAGGRRNSHGQFVDPAAFPTVVEVKEPKVPFDCFPKACYEQCYCWDRCIQTRSGQKWMRFRTIVLEIVDTPAFEWIILFLIFASSVTLCFEDIHLDKNKDLKMILYWTNFFFSSIFVIEMFLKWIAHGFTKYFTSFWTILDFVIVFVSCKHILAVVELYN